jgi:hypothetical protein
MGMRSFAFKTSQSATERSVAATHARRCYLNLPRFPILDHPYDVHRAPEAGPLRVVDEKPTALVGEL